MEFHRYYYKITSVAFVIIVLFSSGITNGYSSEYPTAKTEKEDGLGAQLGMPVQIKKMHVAANIRYRYCRTQVTARAINEDPLMSHEVNFTLRIPRHAFISKFTMNTGNETFLADVVEKDVASAMYQVGKKLDHSGAILTAETYSDSKMFNISLNIEANAEVNFEMIYEEQITRENDLYAYRIYMHPQQMKNVEDFSVKIDMKEFYNISNINIVNLKTRTTYEFFEDVEKKIVGSTAFLNWNPSRNKTRYQNLVSEGALGQFSIHYYLDQDSKPGQVLLRSGYFLHSVNTRDMPILPKHVIFVLDISASMMGLRLRELQSAMKNIFDDLRVDDYFNIITFSSQVQNWSPFNDRCSNEITPFPYDYKNMAVDFIENLEVHGSTNINGALEEALKLSKKISSEKFRDLPRNCFLPKEYEKYNRSNLTFMILFLTDGEPTSGYINRQYILQNIKNRNIKEVPIFSLAFGADADFEFVQKLSLQNHGFSRRVYEGIDSYLQLSKFYYEISSPVLSKITFLYTSPVYNISRVTFAKFSMINKDSDILISGMITPNSRSVIFQKDNRRNMTFPSFDNSNSTKSVNEWFNVSSSKFIDTRVVCQCNFCQNDPDEFISENTTYSPDNECRDDEDQFMERQWAYISIMNMVDSLKAEENSTVKEQIIRMSLQYKFVTPYTSLVIAKPNKNRQNEKTIIDVDTYSDDQLEKNKNPAAFYPRPTPATRRKKPVTLLSAPIEDFTPGPLSQQLDSIAPVDNNNKVITAFNFNMPKSTRIIKNLTSIGNKYNLTNITWLENHRTILFKTENSSQVYTLYDQIQEKSVLSYESCAIRPRNLQGKCKHLKDCVVKEILTDFNVFYNSYFCPINLRQRGNFIGICCQS